MAESVARASEVSELVFDRPAERAAAARELAEHARWCVCLTGAQFELAAARCAAGEQTVESQVLVQKFRERAAFARRVLEGEPTRNGGRR